MMIFPNWSGFLFSQFILFLRFHPPYSENNVDIALCSVQYNFYTNTCLVRNLLGYSL